MLDVAARITAVSPAPEVPVVAATAAIALVVAWPRSRWLQMINVLGTLTHEFGHAALAVLSGGGVQHIQLTGSKSGHTRHVPSGGFAHALTAFAGYCFPPLLGLGAAQLLATGHAAWALTGGFALCLLVLAAAQGTRTVVTVLLIGALFAIVVLFAWSWLIVALAYLVAWLLIATGFEGVLMDVLVPRILSRAMKRDDADTLAGLTRVPAFVWGLAWLALAGWCTWQGAIRLWP
ncbi:M50 family metallopeptidase [Sciscionella marina]|uniref:M50 family metallopeptidase n=1 Tax=Sciscionella marina TaxID=508770 RepID=UPI0003692B04|nr:M50 family metallopeptidase [Sciscionella marina]